MKMLDDQLGNTEAAEERNRVLEEQQQLLEQATERANAYIEDLGQSTEDAQFNLESLNMNPLEKQVAKITRDLKRNLNQEVQNLNKALEEGADPAKIQAQIDAITNATNRAIQAQTDIAKQSYETQRSFSFGWEKAFDEYAENATNAATSAQRIFEKTTRGMEDAIVGFAKTGKFEFKDFLATIAEEILRSQVRILIGKLFGGIGGGSTGNSRSGFAGFFANGGMIPSGQFGVVGEAGPELVSGPAQVTPLGGGGDTVIYNISAVDAPSFQQLIARDPKFIHAVSEKGRQTVAGGRR
jgi:lambda family phage tail tape measure protein